MLLYKNKLKTQQNVKFSKTNKSVLLDERLMGEGGHRPPVLPPGSATDIIHHRLAMCDQ